LAAVIDPRLLRLADRLRARIGIDRGHDPDTDELFGALTLREAVAAGRVSVGRHTYGGPTVHYGPGDQGRVRIGAFCSFAAAVELIPGGAHRMDWVSTYPFRLRWGLEGAGHDGHPAPGRGIEIGNDVWVGRGATILDGVTVGDGAVIGASAVVTRDVRPYAFVGGNPAREIRRRFDDAQIDALLAIGWWNWPDDVIRERVPQLSDGDVDGFVRRYGRP
jgi:acetyltransferase-like isoleucine patch superfamily enzyme